VNEGHAQGLYTTAVSEQEDRALAYSSLHTNLLQCPYLLIWI